jgi:hypothetical protein
MATFTNGYTWGATEQVTSAKLNTMVSGASIANIVNADISASAAIATTKLSGTLESLALETRTDDPVSPAAGRIWVRTDL